MRERNIINVGIVVIKIPNYFPRNIEKINKKLTLFLVTSIFVFRISKRVYLNKVQLQIGIYLYSFLKLLTAN